MCDIQDPYSKLIDECLSLNYDKLKFYILDMRFEDLNEMLKKYECDNTQGKTSSFI